MSGKGILIMSPLGHVLQLTSCGDGHLAEVVRPVGLNNHQADCVQVERENKWLQDEGFVALVVGMMILEANPELEEMCKTIGLA